MHGSAILAATPLPITAQGPPPPPPLPAASHLESRLAHQRKRAAQTGKVQSLKDASQSIFPDQKSSTSQTLRKRFWKSASVKETPEGLQVFLDSRPLRTSTTPRSILTVPRSKPWVALLLAQEWDQLPTAAHALKPHNIPLTSLLNRAVALQHSPVYISPLQPPTSDLKKQTVKTRAEIVAMCMRYLDTDTILCYAPETRSSLDRDSADRKIEERESLRDMQHRKSTPILEFLTTNVFPGLEVIPHTSDQLVPAPQPEMTKQILSGWIAGLPAWELAGLERTVLATKSLLIGVRIIAEWSPKIRARSSSDAWAPSRERFGVEQACEAATVEVRWQTTMWGEVEDTHDVAKEDMRTQIASTIALISDRGEGT